MPRCFTIRKHSAQHNSIQPHSRKISGSSDEKSSAYCDGKKAHRKVAVIQRTSTRTANKKPQLKSRSNVDGSIANRSNRSNSMNGEFKSTIMQRKKLMSSTNAAAQQFKTKATGSTSFNAPTSPTEATIAPTYYNGNTNDSRNEGVIISSKTNEFERLSYSTEENYPRSNYPERSTENVRYEAMVTSPMSITMKTDSSAIINGPAHQTNNPLPSHQMSSAVVYKPIQSVIQSTNSSGNNISTPMSAPSESSFQLNSRSNANGDYLKDSSASHQNQYFVLRSSADGSTINNSQPSVYRERSIEETEAAHDLLSLSQSLPPLPAPCVVTILHPVTNYNVNSPDVQEITPSRPSNEYITNITYTSGRNTQNHSDRTERTERTERIETHARNKKNVSTQFDADMLPDDSSSSDVNPQITPLTPPTSESSSSDVEFVSEAIRNGSTESSLQRAKVEHANKKSQKSKSAQVFGMTIFDAVMINDGRSKKGNGDAEVIHIEERRKGRYKCPQCGKQYATSSNLSRHKQTHRSLDSQSAKKCNTCGKAYVSMPALAMHLLTHKLTHSCDVCGKLFSRPWLLQGHLRSHTGEKPYECGHCGKAFADRSNLRAHMQTHSVNKQFECTKCRKTFALKSYLNKHLESSCLRDDGKKRFDCKSKSDSTENTTDMSMDDDTIDVTHCSPKLANSVDDFVEDDDDEDIIVT